MQYMLTVLHHPPDYTYNDHPESEPDEPDDPNDLDYSDDPDDADADDYETAVHSLAELNLQDNTDVGLGRRTRSTTRSE